MTNKSLRTEILSLLEQAYEGDTLERLTERSTLTRHQSRVHGVLRELHAEGLAWLRGNGKWVATAVAGAERAPALVDRDAETVAEQLEHNASAMLRQAKELRRTGTARAKTRGG